MREEKLRTMNLFIQVYVVEESESETTSVSLKIPWF